MARLDAATFSCTPPRRFSALFWTRAALVLGLALRVFHFLRGMSVWHDEAALIVNVLSKGFLELLGPLYCHEAAPPGFLWLERAVAMMLGDSPWVLRLPSLIASCLALWLFAGLARRWLAPAAAAWAVLYFACSDRLLWHTCEAKPYTLDVLLATVVLCGFDTTRLWKLEHRLALGCLVSPVLILSSYPGCFLCGGLLVAELPVVYRQRKWQTTVGYLAWAAAIGVSFLLLLLGPVRAQEDGQLAHCWQQTFPDWSQPWLVPYWILDNTLQVVHYAVSPVGEFAGVVCAATAWLWWRQGHRDRLAVLVVPVGLALGAACFHAYPYGRYRVMAYAAPAAILLLAGGFYHVWQSFRLLRPVFAGLLGAVMALPLVNTGWRVVHPWLRADAAGACAYVTERIRPGEEVAGNSWEFRYYFRHLPLECRSLEDGPVPTDRPIWLVVLSMFPAERHAVIAQYRATRPLLEVQEFSLITVAHLAPCQALEPVAWLRHGAEGERHLRVLTFGLGLDPLRRRLPLDQTATPRHTQKPPGFPGKRGIAQDFPPRGPPLRWCCGARQIGLSWEK